MWVGLRILVHLGLYHLPRGFPPSLVLDLAFGDILLSIPLVNFRLSWMVIPIVVLSWHPPLVAIIGGLVPRAELVGIGDVPVGIESCHIVICAVPLGIHSLLWFLLVLDSLWRLRVASGFLFYLFMVGFR